MVTELLPIRSQLQKRLLRRMPPVAERLSFPPGIYLSGTVELLSNVTVDLQAGAILKASPNIGDYGGIADYGFGRNYGVDSSGEGPRVGLIVARDAENIAITGHGRIDGNGDSFFNLKSFHNTPDFDPQYTRQGADFDAPKYGLEFGPVETNASGRPGTLIILSHCRNILVRDVTLSNAPNLDTASTRLRASYHRGYSHYKRCPAPQ